MLTGARALDGMRTASLQFAAVAELQRKIAHEAASDAVLLAEVEALPAAVFETDVAAVTSGRALPGTPPWLCHEADCVGCAAL